MTCAAVSERLAGPRPERARPEGCRRHGPRPGLRRARPWRRLPRWPLTAAWARGQRPREQADASGDGTLRIGLILDNTGPQNFLNAPQLAAAKLAVKEINAAGGHKGKPVELLPETVSADTAAQAKALVAAKADVVIGPTDSSRAPAAIDVLSNAKVAIISPANTASGAQQLQERRLLFPHLGGRHRPGPRPRQAGQGRRRQRPLRLCTRKATTARTSSDAVGRRGQGVRTGSPWRTPEFTPGQAQQAAAAAKAADPDAVVLVSRDGAQGAIAELNNAGLAGKKLILSDGAVSQYGSGLGSRALDGARGILPGVVPLRRTSRRELVSVDPGLKDMTFAAETYDAVNLAAVAAAAAEDDAGTSIAATLIAVSGGTAATSGGRPRPAGEPPASRARATRTALDALRAGKRPDYDGESGRIDFDSHGDITPRTTWSTPTARTTLATMSGNGNCQQQRD